jgi:IclR family acetate operon transcriptional repressor
MEHLSSIDKALDVLGHLHAAGTPCGVSELARALGLPKSSTHRLLATLGRRGLVAQDAGGRYGPGLGLLPLALGVLDREPIVAAARPSLERLAAALGETAFLTATRRGGIIVLDKIEGGGFLRAAPRIGSTVPVHATAVGKLQLAHGPDAVEMPVEPFERFTPATRTTARALAADVAAARDAGVAENREEWIAGLAVVAAPVFRGVRIDGALVVAAPAPQLGTRQSREAARLLRREARIVSSLLGPGEGTP